MEGLQAMFPIYLPRPMESGEDAEQHGIGISQNENNINQNFSILYNKLVEIEARLNGG